MSPPMQYDIADIFYSIQGEGFWTGAPATFIRFAGCNLTCAWCDTDHTSRELLTTEALVARILDFPSPHVILTGGEPTLQVQPELVDRLQHHKKIVHMESNGTRFGPAVNWLTISPKQPWLVRQGDELKVVYEGQDMAPYREQSNFSHYYLQPCSMQNVAATISEVQKGTGWKLSIQMHKLLNIP